MMSRNFTTNIFPLTLTSLSLCPQEIGNTSTTPTVEICNFLKSKSDSNIDHSAFTYNG